MDHLVGTAKVELDANKMIARIAELQQLPKEDQEKLFYFWDMTIRDVKTRRAFAS